MTARRLYPGMTCLHGHFIRSKTDLSYSYDKRAGKSRPRCKQCKAATDHNRDLRRPRVKYNLLEKGVCRSGHKINGENDVYSYGPVTARRYRCKQCLRSPVPTYINVECGHKIYFKPPLPEVEEVIYCVRCQGYRMVKEVL